MPPRFPLFFILIFFRKSEDPVNFRPILDFFKEKSKIEAKIKLLC